MQDAKGYAGGAWRIAGSDTGCCTGCAPREARSAAAFFFRSAARFSTRCSAWRRRSERGGVRTASVTVISTVAAPVPTVGSCVSRKHLNRVLKVPQLWHRLHVGERRGRAYQGLRWLP